MNSNTNLNTGNEMIHNLTNSRKYTLRVYIESFQKESASQDYTQFSLKSEGFNYALSFSGSNGTAALSFFNNSTFYFLEYIAMYFVLLNHVLK